MSGAVRDRNGRRMWVGAGRGSRARRLIYRRFKLRFQAHGLGTATTMISQMGSPFNRIGLYSHCDTAATAASVAPVSVCRTSTRRLGPEGRSSRPIRWSQHRRRMDKKAQPLWCARRINRTTNSNSKSAFSCLPVPGGLIDGSAGSEHHRGAGDSYQQLSHRHDLTVHLDTSSRDSALVNRRAGRPKCWSRLLRQTEILPPPAR